MESVTTAINVQIDKEDKEVATSILKNLGLNMSVYVNMAIKQLINKNGVPFEVVNPSPNRELFEALIEGEQIIKEIKSGKRKGYNDMQSLIKALDKD